MPLVKGQYGGYNYEQSDEEQIQQTQNLIDVIRRTSGEAGDSAPPDVSALQRQIGQLTGRGLNRRPAGQARLWTSDAGDAGEIGANRRVVDVNDRDPDGVIILRGSDGIERRFPDWNDEEVGRALESGARPVANGQVLDAQQLEDGGWIVRSPSGEWQTLNRFYDGTWQPGQREALIDMGYNFNPQTNQPPTITGGGFPTGGVNAGIPGRQNPNLPGVDPNTGVPNIGRPDVEGLQPQSPGVPTDVNEMFNYLQNMALSRMRQTQPLIDRAGEFFNYITDQVGNNARQRDQLIGRVLDDPNGNGLYPGLQRAVNSWDDLSGDAYSGFKRASDAWDEAPGLSPEARSAFKITQTRDIPNQFNNAASSLKTELARRGALSNEMPSSGGDIVRAFGPLYAARERAFSDAKISEIMENEGLMQQQRQFNRGLAMQGNQGMEGIRQANRNTSMRGLEGMQNLISQFGNIYNPAQYLGAAGGGLNSMISAFGAGNEPFGQAIQAGGMRGQQEEGSFMNLLKSSLLSTGLGQIPALLQMIMGGNNGNSTGGGGGININPNINIGGGGPGVGGSGYPGLTEAQRRRQIFNQNTGLNLPLR